MESLLAFIPEDRRIALANGLQLADRTNGSVLFADISGFTPLTAALAQELGVHRGAEEVLNQINPIYESIIAELHRFGGSVMGFAGDSITCWLDGDQGVRGVACALAMQQAMRPFLTVKTPAGTPISLAIKVAVTAGPARRFIVGDPDIQLIDVLAGRTLDQVAEAEKIAEKGEVVASQEVAAAIGDACEVLEWRENDHAERFAVVGGLSIQPEPSPHLSLSVSLPEEQVRSWALAPVYSRLKSGSKFLAELRPSVALFLKFTGIDYDNDENAQRKLDNFVRWLQATAEEQDGFLIQLTIGDKGSYAYISFGAPVAHDDDSIRAVATAIDLLEIPDELNYITGIQIGISRGRVWAGECGARNRHTYGVMGNDVNMAARLMSNAQSGQILVRRRVAEESRSVFQFRQLGLMTVKGGAEPIPVAELIGRQQVQNVQGAQFELPLVGREKELERLERLLDAVLAGKGQLVTLQGPTGIGKSHLASVFQQYASQNNFQVAVGTSQRIFQSMTYYPWQQVMRQVFDLNDGPADMAKETEANTQIAALERILTQVNPDWAIRLPLLGDLFGLSIPDNPTTAAFDPKQRQESLFTLIIGILRTWARSQPLLLVFENAHWIDDSSHNLIESLAKATSDVPIMIMAVMRPMMETGAKTAALNVFSSRENHHQIDLDDLEPSEIERLIENLLGGPQSLLARLLIEAKSQGNPFFARELIDSLRESGQLVDRDGTWALSGDMIEKMREANVLVREEGTWVLAQAADLSSINLGIPDSVHGVILARIDRLPDSHKPTLKVASVIGYSFELGLVAHVHPTNQNEVTIRDQAITLEERDFIVQDWQNRTDSVSDKFSFRQLATQEVSYETLLFTQRRELHRNLAVLLEEQSMEAVGQIAYHAFLGEDWERSLRYHLMAGTQNKQLFANIQSIDHFRKALISADHLPPDETLAQRQKIHAGLGELLLTIGQHEEGQESLQTALALAEKLEDIEAQAHACRWLARAFELRGQYEPSLEWINRGLSILGDRVTPAALELRLIGGLIFFRQGDFKRAGQQALACLLAAGELQQPSIVARSHNLLGIIARHQGQIHESIVHVEESLRLYREIGDLHGQSLAQNSLANAYFSLGQWTDADHHYRQAGQTLSQIGNIYNRFFIDNNLGGIALNQGRLDDALLYYSRALRSFEMIGGSLWAMGVIHLNLGATYTSRGELSLAFEHLETSRDLFERAQNRDLLPEMYRRFSEAYIARRDFEQAREAGMASIEIAEELSALGEQGLAWRVIGDIDAVEHRYEASETNFLKAIDMLEQVSDDYGVACARLSLAELDHTCGRYDRCDELLQETVPVFERLGAAIELERARILIDTSAQIDRSIET